MLCLIELISWPGEHFLILSFLCWLGFSKKLLLNRGRSTVCFCTYFNWVHLLRDKTFLIHHFWWCSDRKIQKMKWKPNRTFSKQEWWKLLPWFWIYLVFFTWTGAINSNSNLKQECSVLHSINVATIFAPLEVFNRNTNHTV